MLLWKQDWSLSCHREKGRQCLCQEQMVIFRPPWSAVTSTCVSNAQVKSSLIPFTHIPMLSKHTQTHLVKCVKHIFIIIFFDFIIKCYNVNSKSMEIVVSYSHSSSCCLLHKACRHSSLTFRCIILCNTNFDLYKYNQRGSLFFYLNRQLPPHLPWLMAAGSAPEQISSMM